MKEFHAETDHRRTTEEKLSSAVMNDRGNEALSQSLSHDSARLSTPTKLSSSSQTQQISSNSLDKRTANDPKRPFIRSNLYDPFKVEAHFHLDSFYTLFDSKEYASIHYTVEFLGFAVDQSFSASTHETAWSGNENPRASSNTAAIFDQSSRVTKNIRLTIASHPHLPLPLPTPSWTLPIYANLIQQRAKPVHFLVLILNRIFFNDNFFFFRFVSSTFSFNKRNERIWGRVHVLYWRTSSSQIDWWYERIPFSITSKLCSARDSCRSHSPILAT